MYSQFFLTIERWLAPIQQMFYFETRPFDNMRMSVREPNEDEFAFTAMTGLPPLSCWAFPNSRRHYENYIDFSLAWMCQPISNIAWETISPILRRNE